MTKDTNKQSALAQRWVWVDLEMTGLDASYNVILEIATIVTDTELNVIAEGPDLVIHQSDEELAKMDDWNVSHHGASGLTEQVKASKVSLADAEQQTLAFLQEHVEPGTSPLCGNTVSQDRLFIEAYMPNLAPFFHYRHLDVTSLKILASTWHPEAFAKMPAKQESHRALDDIRESISELKAYRNTLFRSQ